MMISSSLELCFENQKCTSKAKVMKVDGYQKYTEISKAETKKLVRGFTYKKRSMDEVFNNQNEDDKFKIFINNKAVCCANLGDKTNFNSSISSIDSSNIHSKSNIVPSKFTSAWKNPIKSNFLLPFDPNQARKVSLAPEIKQIHLKEKISSKTVVKCMD